jgi:hypothetical protein
LRGREQQRTDGPSHQQQAVASACGHVARACGHVASACEGVASACGHVADATQARKERTCCRCWLRVVVRSSEDQPCPCAAIFLSRASYLVPCFLRGGNFMHVILREPFINIHTLASTGRAAGQYSSLLPFVRGVRVTGYGFGVDVSTCRSRAPHARPSLHVIGDCYSGARTSTSG